MSHVSLSKHFLTYFEPVVATTQTLKEEAFKIRYRVYCEDLGYEPAEKFPDYQEKDEYDDYSIHYLLRHIPSGLFAGCVRVIQPQGKSTYHVFPFEKLVRHDLNLSPGNRHQFCEISRLAVLPEFRKRKGEKTLPEGLIFSGNDAESIAHERRQFSVIALSLYWISIIASYNLHRDILALMEFRLVRHLNRCSIFSEQIGDFAEYHGKRAPFWIKTTHLMQRMNSDEETNENLKEFVTLLQTFLTSCPLFIDKVEVNHPIVRSNAKVDEKSFATPLYR